MRVSYIFSSLVWILVEALIRSNSEAVMMAASAFCPFSVYARNSLSSLVEITEALAGTAPFCPFFPLPKSVSSTCDFLDPLDLWEPATEYGIFNY